LFTTNKIAPSVNVQNATLRINQQTIFNQLALHLKAGKFTCLLGPSGVGKSTLLRLLANIMDAPNIHIAATITASDAQPVTSRIAYMGQSDMLLPWLNVLNNTLLGARLRRRNTMQQREKAKYLLQQVGLTEALQKHPAALSGGMRQRVALARTLMEDKPIVLMDEPFSALDAITRLKLQELAAGLLKNKTVLLVTHDPLEALRLGHVVQVMQGQPAQLAPPMTPPGLPPRATTDQQLLELQGQLLRQLEQAQEKMGCG
jgi:putative hydroxymethylpyrimidine transport system ATP-binding protein